MIISNLEIFNFRNYDNFKDEFSDKINIFIGDNAQGKTNLLEAIYITGTTKSFRKANPEKIIKFGEKNARINAKITKNSIEKDIKIHYLSKNSKKIFINNKQIHKTSDYLGNLNITLFSPEELNLIKGESSERRNFLDSILCQTDKLYLIDLINYYKIIKQKNYLLKEKKHNRDLKKELEPWNIQIAEYASKIVIKRLKFLENNRKSILSIHDKLTSNEKMDIKYIDKAEGQEVEEDKYKKNFISKQKEIIVEEIKRGFSLLGPHRDKIEININGYNTRFFSSQGQQRTAAITLKLAEIEYIYLILKEYPILLLDDVFSELDDKRQEYIINFLNKDIQIFITGAKQADFIALFPKAKIFEVKSGKVTKS